MSSRRLVVSFALATGLFLLASCERTPDSYDYHGPAPDSVTLDSWNPSDVQPLDVDATNPLPDAHPQDSLPDTAQDSLDESSPPDAVELSDVPTPTQRVRECKTTLSFTPPDGTAPAMASELFVSSAEQPWAEAEKAMTADGSGKYTLELDLSTYAAGSYGYKFHTASDNWYLDPSNPLAKFQGGFENSKIVVPDCALPSLTLASSKIDAAAGTLSVKVEAWDGVGSTGLVPSSATLRVDGVEHAAGYDPETATFNVQLSGLTQNSKVNLLFTIANQHGTSKPLFVPLWIEETPWSWREALMYFAFTDRFYNGNTNNDAPANCENSPKITDWNGGDFQGLLNRVEDGYFDKLGVNAIWISAVVDNPNGCMTGSLAGIKYTAYHGYFPVDFYKTEDHFGSIEDLRALVNAAHEHGIRILVDLVGNHCHQESSLWADHATDWFNTYSSCEPNWDQPITCWFQSYLPDFDYTKDEVVEYITDNAIYWIMETGIDGFRVDAVKHMVHNFTKTLRYKIHEQIESTTGLTFYMVGETFVDEWGGGTGAAETTIKEYISDWELNGQFDFPFYWKILRAVGRDEGDFTEFSQFLDQSLSYWGSNAIMVSFIGNHDVPRFISHAAGQIADKWGNGSKEQGISNPPAQPSTSEPYARSRLALGLMLSLPEIPLIYYGDEVGLAGAGDPDNRRMMPFESLSAEQSATLEFVRKVGVARKELAPLRLGDFATVTVTATAWVFKRTYEGKTVFIVANRSESSANVSFQPQVSGNLTNYLTDATIPINGGTAQVALDGLSMVILTTP